MLFAFLTLRGVGHSFRMRRGQRSGSLVSQVHGSKPHGPSLASYTGGPDTVQSMCKASKQRGWVYAGKLRLHGLRHSLQPILSPAKQKVCGRQHRRPSFVRAHLQGRLVDAAAVSPPHSNPRTNRRLRSARVFIGEDHPTGKAGSSS